MTARAYEKIRVSRDGVVEAITLYNPERRNAIGPQMTNELLHALEADPSELTLWRQGRSLPYGEGVTFWALGEMVKAQAGILESDSPEQAGAAFALSRPTAGARCAFRSIGRMNICS